MPAEYNAERTEYYPSNDLAYSFFRNRVIEVLTTWCEQNIVSINDCIEVFECKQTIENHGHLFQDPELGFLHNSAQVLFGFACKHASFLLNASSIVDLYETIELQYCDRFWLFVVTSGLFKSIDSQEFLELLRANPHTFREIVKHEPLVKLFDAQLTEAFKENAHYAAELIIGCFGADCHSNEAAMLPKSLTNDAIDLIMLAYLEDDYANLNYVRVLEIWPQEAHSAYNPSPGVLVAAKKASLRLNAELFQNGTCITARYGVGITFSPDQKACKGIVVEDGNIALSYSLEWLAKYTDPGTVLNNFIHVFDFVNAFGLLTTPANKHEGSSLLETLGVHALGEYPSSTSFNMRNMQVLMIVLAYRRFLLDQGTRLEKALEWFFNDYIEDEFRIAGFSISLPTEETSLFDKCKSIGPEIERVLKAFQIYVEHGEIDSDYFRFTPIKQFKSLPSLLKNKYVIEGEGISRYGQVLFSNQSLLAHCPSYPDSNTFFAAITAHRARISDYNERYSALLRDLSDKGFISIKDGCIIEATTKTKLLEKVWEYGALPMHCLSKEYEAIVDELVSGDYLKYSGSLLSPHEADYMNFMFNDACFSNSMAIRNRYDHADGSVDNPNSQEKEQDYCYLLVLLIFLVLKINEELSLFTGKGGVEDFVDWPLIDEEMLNEALTRLPSDGA